MYAIAQWFQMHPDNNECFATGDGVLHATEEVAAAYWAKRDASQRIVKHEREAAEAEEKKAAAEKKQRKAKA